MNGFTYIKIFFLAIILWAITTLVPVVAFAQATISGNISGVKNGATVIIGSNIWLESGQSGQDIIHSNKGSRGIIVAKTRTDSQGNYTVNVASGTYIIIVWANGFTPESDTINAPGNFSTVLLPTQRSSLHTSLTFGDNVTVRQATPPAPPPAPTTPSLSGNIGGTIDAIIILGNNIWFETGQSGQDIVHGNKGSRAVIVAKTKTERNGNYTINVAPGNYTVIVWAVGFTPESDEVTVPGNFSTVLLPTQRSSLHRSITFGSGINIQAGATNNSAANNPANNNPATNQGNTPVNNEKTPTQTKGIWQKVATEIYLNEKQTNALPTGKTMSVLNNTEFTYVFSGGEFNLTRTDSFRGNQTGRITYTWTLPPAQLVPKQEYQISCESVGNAGNGILLSRLVGYSENYGNNYPVASFRNGKKIGRLLVPEYSGTKKMRIVAELSSGASNTGSVLYCYIYEWQPNGTVLETAETNPSPGWQNPSGQVVNLALNKPCQQSSIYVGTGVDQGANCAVDGRIEPDRDPYYMIHTNIENNPWWQVDLGKVFSLTSIRLHNRINAGERAKLIQAFISQDGRNWERVYAHNGSMWKTLNINVNGQQARFVKVQLADRNYLHLFEVEVFGYNN